MALKILVLEDNGPIARALCYSLEQNGYETERADCIIQARNLVESREYDLAILDITLPDGNGFDFYKKYVKPREIPAVFLTAKDDEDDIVKGLESGAEDYVTKPFSTRELMARISRILGRKTGSEIKIKDLVYDSDKMTVTRNGEVIPLSSLELKLFSYFVLNKNKVVTRDNIIQKIWDLTGNDVNDNTVTVYMKRIRQKLGADIIVTIKGIGYRLDE